MLNSSKLRNLVQASLLCVAALAFMTPAHAATTVNGSGSTFVHPVMLKWVAGYHAKTGVQVSYQPIGSGAGIRQIKERAVTFGASDKPLLPEELQAAGLAQFPVVIGRSPQPCLC